MTPEEYKAKYGDAEWPLERTAYLERCKDFAETFEPERIKFWLRYRRDYLEACRAVAENTPSFDLLWKEAFGDGT